MNFIGALKSPEEINSLVKGFRYYIEDEYMENQLPTYVLAGKRQKNLF